LKSYSRNVSCYYLQVTVKTTEILIVHFIDLIELVLII
jgi:hypothetical protein